MRYRPIQAASRERVPITLWGPMRFRRILATVAASAVAFAPAVMFASPAQAAPADYLTIAGTAGWEGEDLTFTLTYTGPGPQTFVISAPDGDADGDGNVETGDANGDATLGGPGVDYDTDLGSSYWDSTPPPQEITFPASTAGSPSRATLTVTTNDDADNVDESFTLRATPKTGGGPAVDATGTIWASVDNGGASAAFPTFTLLAPSTVPESQSTVTVTATLARTMTHDVTIPVRTVVAGHSPDPDAVSTGGTNRDYTALPVNATIVIAAGQLSGTVAVSLWDDSVDEATQYFRVESHGNLLGATGSANVDIGITDNDPTPTISIGDATAVTENSPLAFPVTLSSLSETEVTATLTPSSGADTATTYGGVAGTDFPSTPVTVRIPAYNKTVNALVPTSGDTKLEGTETLNVTLSAPSGATLGSPTTATGSINDDEAKIAVTLDTDTGTGGLQTSYAEGATGEVNAFITVAGTAPADQEVPLRVEYTFSGGTATNGVDYRASGGSFTIPTTTHGGFTQQIPVTIIGDRLFETPNETIKLTLTSPNDTILAASLGEKTLTIAEAGDDVQPTWTTGDVTVVEGNTGTTTARIPVTMSGSTNADVTFNAVFTEPGSTPARESGVNSGTTVGENDYDYSTVRSVTIPAGSTTGYLEVPVNGDAVYEPNESFTVTFSTSSTNVVTTATPRAASIVTITNDDAKPKLVFNDTAGAEGTFLRTSGTIVGLSQDAYDITITYGSGTGDNAAVSGTDFDPPASVTRSIARGFTGALTPFFGDVYLSPDNIDEAQESFTLTATESSTILKGFETSVGTYKVNDDPSDVPPAASIRDETIGENEGSVDVHVDLAFTGDTTSTTQTVTIPYWTENGSAHAGSDYTATKGTLQVAPGKMSAVINVPIRKDGYKEGAETFSVKLGTPAPAGAAIAKGVSTVTILANDGGTMPTDPGEQPGGEQPGGEQPGTGTKPTINVPARVTGAVAVPITGKAPANTAVELWGAPMGDEGDLKYITSVQSDAQGNYSFSRWIGQGYRFATQANEVNSDFVQVTVAQNPVFVASSPSRGRLAIAVQGNPRGPNQTVIVQRQVNGKWVNAWRGTTGSNNRWNATVNVPAGSTHTLRAFVAGHTPDGLLPGYSAAKRVTIR